MSNKKQEDKEVLWWIFNQEETPIGMSVAKTAGGALAKFEVVAGVSREGYRAEKAAFSYGCSIVSGYPVE